MLIDPADHCASILAVNTTDTGAPAACADVASAIEHRA